LFDASGRKSPETKNSLERTPLVSDVKRRLFSFHFPSAVKRTMKNKNDV